MSQAQDLDRGIAELGLEVAPEVRQKLMEYLSLLQRWNKVYNLTAIRDPQQMISHHLLDSLAVLPYIWPGRWLDVGCGAGLPGLVLAAARPDWTFDMLDSNSKKTSFVQQAAIEMGLTNVRVHCARVEDFAPSQLFDGIISRAFAEASDFVSSSRHLLAVDGHWAAMKGAPDPELSRLPPDVTVERTVQLKVPRLNAARSLVILRAN